MSSLSNPRLRLSTGQLVLGALATTVLVALSISSFTSSNKALQLATQANSATTQSTAIIITQRETLVYAVRFSEWLRGTIIRRDLQITRGLLAQRLEVVDSTGASIGSRANLLYLQTLKKSDALVASADPGFLSLDLQKQFRDEGNSIITAIISEGHLLIDEYSRTVGEQIQGFAASQKTASSRNLYLLIMLILIMSILITWTGGRIRNEYRREKILKTIEETRLKEVREELGEAKETVRALTNLNAAENEFVATINHELRTPLTSIIGYVEILKDFSSLENPDEFHKYLDILEKNATVLLDLVESILLLSAIDASNSQDNFRECNLREICRESVTLLHLDIDAKSLQITILSDDAQDYLLLGNPAQLSQVFRNLISNAVKFSPRNSRIQIVLSRESNNDSVNKIRVDVRDEGIGISNAEIGQLFTRFFRASNASESQIPGSGLGLAIVKKIVALHFGEVSVKSALGHGTTMTVKLPLSLSPAEILVLIKRKGVLERAIESISLASEETMLATCHEIGGSIGFYTFIEEGAEILNFLKWIQANPGVDFQLLLSKKEGILEMLRRSLSRISD